MPYRIAGIDVHKAMLAVVVADVEVAEDWQFERRRFGASPSQLRLLCEWLVEREVEEVVMESTAQYWRPVGPPPARCISRKRSRMVGGAAGSETSPMQNDWSNG